MTCPQPRLVFIIQISIFEKNNRPAIGVYANCLTTTLHYLVSSSMTGYIYILSNVSMPGLIKIGYTKRSPEERKRELSRSTGVPIDFEIVYEIYSTDIKRIEREVHLKLSKYRFSKEFFKTDVDTAIDILRKKVEELRLEREAKTNGINELYDTYEAVEILGRLKQRYPDMIQNQIKSVRIYQTRVRCYLEILEEFEYKSRGLIDQTIHRSDLAFIADPPDNPEEEDVTLFTPRNKVTENARIFIEDFDSYSIINCTDLFTDEAAKRVSEEFHSRRTKES